MHAGHACGCVHGSRTWATTLPDVLSVMVTYSGQSSCMAGRRGSDHGGAAGARFVACMWNASAQVHEGRRQKHATCIASILPLSMQAWRLIRAMPCGHPAWLAHVGHHATCVHGLCMHCIHSQRACHRARCRIQCAAAYTRCHAHHAATHAHRIVRGHACVSLTCCTLLPSRLVLAKMAEYLNCARLLTKPRSTSGG